MVRDYFGGKARHSFWSVHVEAWRRSGLTRRKYCFEHSLDQRTFARWLKHLIDEESLKERDNLRRKEAWRKRRMSHSPLSADKRSKAVQAFWAMHVEALIWSGMSARSYGSAHHISHYTLNKWRKRMEAGEFEIDWREHLHPSSLPKISTSRSTSASRKEAQTPLTIEAKPDPAPVEKQQRRSFSAEEKLAIVMESESPGATVSSVARAYNIVTSVLFRWRAELGFGRQKRPKLAAVTVNNHAGGSRTDPVVLHDLLPVPDGMIAVDLGDGRRVFVPEGSNAEDVRREVATAGEPSC